MGLETRALMPTKSRIDSFATGAGALVAGHRASDIVWGKYFPKLPRERPELRTILIELHHSASAAQALHVSAAERMIMNRFGVSDRSASKWLKKLENELLIVRVPGERDHEIHLVPSESTKVLLRKVGLEYLAFVRLVFQLLGNDAKVADHSNVDWANEIGQLLRSKVFDYGTIREKEPGKRRRK
jgi:DNA-binding MarR family transcriptional regulator